MSDSIINEILIQILNNKKIAIFRHANPDGDAVFSQYALCQFIKDNFKDKTVKCLGNDLYDLYPKHDKASDKFIEESLVFVLDTSNIERIDDQRFSSGNFIIKIDHHPNVNIFGNLLLVEDYRSACSEVLANILLEYEKMGYILSKKTAQFLLSGILTDSNSFTTSSTTADTLEIASKLVNKGLNLSELNVELFSKDKEEFETISIIRNSIIIKDGFAYALFDNKDLKKNHLNFRTVKNNVNVMANIKGVNVWCIIVYNNETKLYECSARANNDYIVNTVMKKYNGGGHNQAAACKNFKKEQISAILDDLYKVSKSR